MDLFECAGLCVASSLSVLACVLHLAICEGTG